MARSNLESPPPDKGPFFRLVCLSPLLVVAISFYFCHEIREGENKSMHRSTENHAETLATLLDSQLHDDLHEIRRMEKRWERDGGSSRESWQADAELYVKDHTQITAFGWIDADHIVRWIAPLEGNEEAVNLKLNFEGRRAKALRRARETGEYAISRPVELVQGGVGVLVIFSLEIDEKPTGFLSAVMNPETWVAKSIGHTSSRYHLRVRNEDELVYLRDDEGKANSIGWVAGPIVCINGLDLQIEARPRLETAAAYRSSASILILVAGLIVATLLAITVFYWQRSIDREVAIKASQQRFNRAVRGTSDGLWEWHVGTNDVWYAPRFKELLGYEDHEFADTMDAFKKSLHPEDYDRTMEAVTRHVSSNAPYNVDYRLRTKDGNYRWFHARGQSDKLGDAKFTMMSGSIQDITDRKAAILEIAQRNSDLETLLHVTSHDLREPLRAIRNFSQLIAEEHANQLNEEGSDFLKRIIRGGDRLDTLLDDILKLSRAQRADVSDLAFNLKQPVDDAIKRLTDQIELTGASIKVAADLPQVTGDPTWITQAIYNILSNALKFTNPGQSPQIEITTIQSDTDRNLAGLSISDRGPGVPAESVDRIFKLFQRAVGRDIPGTGAGLAIVRQIVERHHGQVWYEPRDGGGASFCILFPVATEPLSTDMKRTESEAAA